MARLMDVFPSQSTYEAVGERVNEHWEFIKGFPVPKWEMNCSCGSKRMQARQFTFLVKSTEPLTYPYRCFCSFKCIECSKGDDYQLVITKEVFDMRAKGQPVMMYKWREALEIINGN